MKKKYICLILFLMCSVMYSQVLVPLRNYSSPNVASLGSYGEIPVNLYTGIPQISIPIYNLKDGPISVPIQLDYNISSVKPNKHPGWVGLGWSLSCGGYISRTVRGRYDECKDIHGNEVGYYAHYSKLKSCNTFQDYNKHIQSLICHPSTCYELMADEFNFNFCGYSGRFYLNEQGEWVVVGDNVRIEFDDCTGFLTFEQLMQRIDMSDWNGINFNSRFFDKFTIITPDGVRYSFGGISATEYSISYYQRNSSYLIPTTWYLKTIVSPNGHKVKFEYDPGEPICEINRQYSDITTYDKKEIVSDWSLPANNGFTCLSGFLMFPVYLKSINSSMIDIDFISSKSLELRHNPRLLFWKHNMRYFNNYFDGYYSDNPADFFGLFMKNKIDISSNFQWKALNNIIIKTVDNRRLFSFFYSSNTEERLKLKRLTQSGDAINKSPILNSELNKNNIFNKSIEKTYQFVYNPEKMPNYIYANEDHWGYCNGKIGSIYDINVLNNNYYKSRNPNSYYLNAETLIKIIYPTGGNTTFEYEPNNYSSYVNSTKRSFPYLVDTLNSIAGGLRISTISSFNNDGSLAIKKKYHYCKEFPKNGSENISSGILKYLPLYNVSYTCQFPESNNKHSFIGIANLSFSGCFTKNTTNDDGVAVSYSTIYEEIGNNSNSTMTKYQFSNFDNDIWGESHCDEPPYFTNFSQNNPYSEFSSKSIERGKLMSEEYFDSNNKIVKSIKYKYNRTSDKYLKTVQQHYLNLFPFAQIYNTSVFKTYLYSYLPSYKVEKLYDTSSKNKYQTNEYYYTYNEDNLIKSEKKIINKENFSETLYRYSGDLIRANSTELKQFHDKFLLNNIVGKIIKKNNSKVLSGELYLYKEDQYKNIVLHKKMIFDSSDRTDVFSWNNFTLNNFDSRFKEIASYKYDNHGNIIEINQNNGQKTTYLWGYKYQFPVAKIQNCSLNKVLEIIGDLDLFSSADKPNIQKIRALRYFLKNALVTTYLYDPLSGVTQETFPNGYSNYFYYNCLGQLLLKKDGKGNFIESFDYEYKY